jgi:hypothetical protein
MYCCLDCGLDNLRKSGHETAERGRKSEYADPLRVGTAQTELRICLLPNRRYSTKSNGVSGEQI